MSRRFRASPRRGGRRQLRIRRTTSQAQTGARGEEFSLVHQVLHKIPFVRSDISLLPDYIHWPAGLYNIRLSVTSPVEPNLQFRQWGRVTGKDQRGEDGNELAKGVECGD